MKRLCSFWIRIGEKTDKGVLQRSEEGIEVATIAEAKAGL